jgi:ubiquinone/menaquinone biosynthesis C-methylase UbiE
MYWGLYLRIPSIFSISRAEVNKILLSYPPCYVLDVGAGYGRISLFLKVHGFQVIAIDNNVRMVKICRNKGIEAKVMDAFRLEFPSNSFDLVVSDGLLEHFENPLPLIKEQARVSRKWILNFIPKDTFLNTLLEKLQMVPKEFRRSKEEWILLHRKCCKKVNITELTRLLAIKGEV